MRREERAISTEAEPVDRRGRGMDPHRYQPEPTLTAGETSAKAGLTFEVTQKLNRALGFPDVAESAREFSERDVEVLASLKAILDLGIPLQELIAVARVYGQSLAAIADAETRLFNDHLVGPLLEGGHSIDEVEERLEPVVDQQLDVLGAALDYVHRRHLAMALPTLTAGRVEAGGEQAAIAFADLVDFSRLADKMHGTELGELVDWFEDLVIEATVDPGVRIVKMIGDAAMLAGRDRHAVLVAAAGIVQRVTDDERLPGARAGVDFGNVIAQAGDFFGRPVNVAARLVAFARPGTTVVSQELLEAVGEDSVRTSKIGTHRLKGVGRVRMFKVNSLGPAAIETNSGR